MRLKIVFAFSITLCFLACSSPEINKISTPLSEQNLRFETYDSLVVDYLGNLALMDISPDGNSFLLIDQNTDSILVTKPSGEILYQYLLKGDGPENYPSSRMGVARFISNDEFVIPTQLGFFRYSIKGALLRKFEPDFNPSATLMIPNGDNLAISGDTIFSNFSGRFYDEGLLGIEYQQKAKTIELLAMNSGDFTPIIPFPKESRFSSTEEEHPGLAYYTNLALKDDSLYISFRNEAKIYSYSLNNLQSPASVKNIPFKTFINALSTEDGGQNVFQIRNLFTGTINRMIPMENAEFLIDYLSGLKDEEASEIMGIGETDFEKMFEEAEKINTAGMLLFDGSSISPLIEKPSPLGSLNKYISKNEIWFSLNFSEAENDYSVIYKTRLVEK